ncbi:MAG: hypothetical protein IPP49_20935 [Saprospiraceae bacterium]|nr:hypothetical protein [Saprospiraceae bacterium]
MSCTDSAKPSGNVTFSCYTAKYSDGMSKLFRKTGSSQILNPENYF